jgi:hypothetical protein
MTTLHGDEKTDTATGRQRAACALRSENDRSTVTSHFTDRTMQRWKHREWSSNTARPRDHHKQTRQQRHPRRSNPHRPHVHSAEAHYLRGFLPWGSSVACR